MHLQLMHHPRMCAQTNGFQQPVHSALSVFSAKKKVRVVSPSYAQNKAQMGHPKRLLVAVLNATRIALWRWAG